jgi:hypothetical protein
MMYDIQQGLVFAMHVFSIWQAAKIKSSIKKSDPILCVEYQLLSIMKTDITFLSMQGFSTNLLVHTILSIKKRFK